MYTYNDENFSQVVTESNSKEKLESVKEKVRSLFDKIFSKTGSDSKYYNILHFKDAESEISQLTPIAKQIRNSFTDVIIVGMGGATLAPQTINSLNLLNVNPKIHFLNFTDPIAFKQFVSCIDLNKTALLVISNSGKTIETISMLGALLSEMSKAGITDVGQHSFFLVGPNNNPLRAIAEELGATILDHSTNIGGRFSAITSVGILSGLIANLNMHEFARGLRTVVEDFWKNKEDSMPCRAAISAVALDKPIWVCLAYLNSFSPFLQWYAQIIAESLGKDGKGYTPLVGIGPMDQHSVLQLYLDGPKNKLYTMLYVKNTEEYDSKISPMIQPEFLQLKSLDNINHAMFDATLKSLKNQGNFVRTIMLDKMDEFNLGCLWMHAALEVITAGHIMEINPFDQPGVEQIKIEAEKLIKAL